MPGKGYLIPKVPVEIFMARGSPSSPGAISDLPPAVGPVGRQPSSLPASPCCCTLRGALSSRTGLHDGDGS